MKDDISSKKLRIVTKEGKKYIFDFIRKKYLLLTPEEWVRQKILLYLIEEKKYPQNLIRVEQKLKGKKQFFRTDAVVYDRNGVAKIIIECKAENVKITQDVFEQITKYNIQFMAPYLLVTNGLKNYFCKINHNESSYEFLKDIPSFSEIIAGI
ncbi:MAG: type I restriction enzyme HsdR N-terminal domain-containing protein [Bacteroidales bacterium]|nr:type I restriction enzyme HsdR N-terminal domain-containing protein [Bacteroidales bacterium]